MIDGCIKRAQKEKQADNSGKQQVLITEGLPNADGMNSSRTEAENNLASGKRKRKPGRRNSCTTFKGAHCMKPDLEEKGGWVWRYL